jgi:hypothetical protein
MTGVGWLRVVEQTAALRIGLDEVTGGNGGTGGICEPG